MRKLIPPHPFPARMSPELALSVLSDAPKGALVLDPMCGSGTVVRAAGEHGLRASGFDIDPLAVLMARVWTSPIDVRLLRRSAELVVKRARTYSQRDIRLPWVDGDPTTRTYVDFWFDRPQRRQLRTLVASIRRSPLSVRDALKLGLSRTIITKERGASLARDVSHSRPHKVKTSNDFDVLSGFLTSINRIATQLELEPPPSMVRVSAGDARSLSKVRSNSVDLILTSPPYLNAIDYMRGHRMSLVWLGHTIGDLRDLRSASIGSERGPDPGHNPALVDDLMSLLPRKIDEFSPRTKRIFQRYVIDLHAVVDELVRVAKRGARVIFVMGNSTIEGLFVSNADALIAVATRAGLRFVEGYERDLPPNSRYLPPPKHGGTNPLELRMRSESVLTFANPA